MAVGSGWQEVEEWREIGGNLGVGELAWGTCTGYVDKSPDVVIDSTVLHRIDIKEA